MALIFEKLLFFFLGGFGRLEVGGERKVLMCLCLEVLGGGRALACDRLKGSVDLDGLLERELLSLECGDVLDGLGLGLGVDGDCGFGGSDGVRERLGVLLEQDIGNVLLGRGALEKTSALVHEHLFERLVQVLACLHFFLYQNDE